MTVAESTMVARAKQAWRVPSRVERYRALQGWIDDGERSAFMSIADEVRAQPILDLGVGAGRTTAFMRLLTDAYVAVDSSPEMVAAARAVFPGLDVRHGDARDLSEFPSATYSLVLFSYNGIDYLDHDGRLRVYDEVRRVLRPGGIFAYSTFSKDSHLYGQRPWFQGPWPPTVRRVARGLVDAPRRLPRLPALYANWWKSHRASEDHGGWGTAPVAALDFELVHFTTVRFEQTTLAERGFGVRKMLDRRGSSTSARCDDPWFFVLAEKKHPASQRSDS
jgi:SAM-dependent methyltransferase